MITPSDSRWPLAIQMLTERTRAGRVEWWENDGRYPFRSFLEQVWAEKHPHAYVSPFEKWVLYVYQPRDTTPELWFGLLDSVLNDTPVQIQVEGVKDLYDAVVEHVQRVQDKFLDELLVALDSLKPADSAALDELVGSGTPEKKLSIWKRLWRWL